MNCNNEIIGYCQGQAQEIRFRNLSSYQHNKKLNIYFYICSVVL